jgi:transcriptional regulator with XRE-family HTH domain
MTQNTLAETLRVIRARKGLTLAEAGELVGVNRHTLRDLELGKREPYGPTLRKLADGYGMTISELLGEGAPAGKASAPSGAERENLAEVLMRLGSPTQYLASDNLGSRVREATDEEARGIYRAAIQEALLLAPELERWLVIYHPKSADWVYTTTLWSTAGERLHALRLALLAKGGAEAVPIELTQATNTLESALGGMR